MVPLLKLLKTTFHKLQFDTLGWKQCNLIIRKKECYYVDTYSALHEEVDAFDVPVIS